MIWRDLLSCLSPQLQPSPSLLSLEDKAKADPDCIFCHVTSRHFEIIRETKDFIVFRDRSPAALYHLLAIPRTHIANIKAIKGTEGASLVKQLQREGQSAIEAVLRSDEEANETRFGFHIPPFRSVDHLHLHCLVLPFRSTLKAAKYRVALGDPQAHPPTSKGWGWFVTASQAVEILERNGDIKVGSC